MSVLEDISKNIAVLPDKLENYSLLLEEAEPLFELEGKRLELICRDHAKNLWFYKKQLNDLKTIEDYIKMKVDAISSEKWKHYNEGYSRALSQKDIQQYISGEPEYIQMFELQLEVTYIKKQFEAVVDALTDMNWMLSHMTKLRVAELEDLAIL